MLHPGHGLLGQRIRPDRAPGQRLCIISPHAAGRFPATAAAVRRARSRPSRNLRRPLRRLTHRCRPQMAQLHEPPRSSRRVARRVHPLGPVQHVSSSKRRLHQNREPGATSGSCTLPCRTTRHRRRLDRRDGNSTMGSGFPVRHARSSPCSPTATTSPSHSCTSVPHRLRTTRMRMTMLCRSYRRLIGSE